MFSFSRGPLLPSALLSLHPTPRSCIIFCGFHEYVHRKLFGPLARWAFPAQRPKQLTKLCLMLIQHMAPLDAVVAILLTQPLLTIYRA